MSSCTPRQRQGMERARRGEDRWSLTPFHPQGCSWGHRSMGRARLIPDPPTVPRDAPQGGCPPPTHTHRARLLLNPSGVPHPARSPGMLLREDSSACAWNQAGMLPSPGTLQGDGSMLRHRAGAQPPTVPRDGSGGGERLHEHTAPGWSPVLLQPLVTPNPQGCSSGRLAPRAHRAKRSRRAPQGCSRRISSTQRHRRGPARLEARARPSPLPTWPSANAESRSGGGGTAAGRKGRSPWKRCQTGRAAPSLETWRELLRPPASMKWGSSREAGGRRPPAHGPPKRGKCTRATAASSARGMPCSGGDLGSSGEDDEDEMLGDTVPWLGTTR